MSEDGVLLLVDEIEDEDAWLLAGEKRYRVPRELLPAAAREGTWLRWTIDQAPGETRDMESRRERLTRADPGGKVKL